MSIRKKIEADFITAFKAKDLNAKSALSSIKAAITVAEKANPQWESTDDEVIKIVNKGIKQRQESIKMYETANRLELAQKERDEMEVLQKYMPAQMTTQEITDALIEIMQGFSGVITNPNALQGKTIGEFNKKYQGRADIGAIREILSKLVES